MSPFMQADIPKEVDDREMAHEHETSKAGGCPTMEAWCAYADGSAGGSERAALAGHLRQCDRCFALVASIRRALEEPEEEAEPVQTPEALLKQARRIGAPAVKRVRWVAYAAAAVLVLGLGIRALYSPAPDSHPLSGAVFAQLSGLDRALQAQGHTWSDLMAEQVRSPSGIPETAFDIPAPSRAAANAGCTLILLKVHLEYADDPEGAAMQVAILRLALSRLAPHDPLLQAVDAIAPVLEGGDMSAPGFSDRALRLCGDVERLVRKRGPEAEAYFLLGQWLQGVRITASTALYLAAPFTSVSEVARDVESAHRLSALLRDIRAPEGIRGALAHLISQIEKAGGDWEKTDEILTLVDRFLDALIPAI